MPIGYNMYKFWDLQPLRKQEMSSSRHTLQKALLYPAYWGLSSSRLIPQKICRVRGRISYAGLDCLSCFWSSPLMDICCQEASAEGPPTVIAASTSYSPSQVCVQATSPGAPAVSALPDSRASWSWSPSLCEHATEQNKGSISWIALLCLWAQSSNVHCYLHAEQGPLC